MTEAGGSRAGGGQLNLPLPVGDGLSFANFHRGANGELVERLRRLAEGEAGCVCLHGPRGSGRTHLLTACCRHAGDRRRLAAYLTLRDPAVQPELVRQLNGGALVCVDDVERAAGNMAWETALLDLYERVAEGGGALAVTAPAPPAALGLLADLASRLSAGALYRVVPLTEAQRRVAFVERARRRGFDLDPAVVDYLLDRVPRDNNTVFGLLDRIDRAALSERRRVTIPFLKAHVLR